MWNSAPLNLTRAKMCLRVRGTHDLETAPHAKSAACWSWRPSTTRSSNSGGSGEDIVVCDGVVRRWLQRVRDGLGSPHESHHSLVSSSPPTRDLFTMVISTFPAPVPANSIISPSSLRIIESCSALRERYIWTYVKVTFPLQMSELVPMAATQHRGITRSTTHNSNATIPATLAFARSHTVAMNRMR